MQSPLTFDRPWLLLLLPVAALLLWLTARRSYAGLHPATQNLALAARCIVATLLVFAVAGTHIVKRSNTLTTLFLLDVSRSVRPDQRAQGIAYVRKALENKRGDDMAGIVVFGRTAFMESAPSETLQQLDNIHASVAGDATDLSEALQIAQAAFPPGAGRKIVLLSDGNENKGSAEGEIERLRADGVVVDVAPTALGQTQNGGPTPEAMVEGVTLPARARQSAPFGMRVVVSSTTPQGATLTVTRDGRPIARQKVSLKAGKNAFNFQEKVETPGFHKYDAQIQAAGDGVPENNHASGYVAVTGKPRVLYVTDTDAPSYQTLKTAMARQQIELQIQPPGALSASVPALAAFDSIVLSNIPSEELGPQQMAALEVAVRDFGVGFGMVGGENSFGAGRYNNTPIEAALPVRMDVRKQRRLPPAAVVVVLDASGSMASTENGIQKVQLGARAAVQLMGALQPDDQIAVTTVTETTTVAVPLQPAAQASKARGLIESVHAGGGGIFCYQGLSDAYAILQRSNAPIRHVILCADTGDSDQQDGAVELAQEMLRKEHITTTVCGIGHREDQHVPFQKALAKAGNGQLFIVNQASDLPKLFQRDVQMIQQSLFIEKPFLARYNPADIVINGINWATQPPLLGYDLTTAKPGATLALTAPGEFHDPVFATWRYGLGRTFAFTSDDRAHWAVRWLGWDGYQRFWAQALRWSLRSNTNADFQADVSNESGKGRIVVDAFNESSGFINKANLTAKIVAPDLTVKQVPLAQTAPGRYEGNFDTDQTGAYMVNVRKGSGTVPTGGPAPPSQTVGLVVPYSPEYRTLGPDLPLLTRLAEATGGKIQPDPTRIFRDAPSWVVGVLDLAPALLLLSALLFLTDIAIRRLAIRPSQVRDGTRRTVEAAGTRLAALKNARAPRVSSAPSTPQMERLLSRKTASRAAVEDDAATTTERLLSRQASRAEDDGDNPFPQVASLPSKVKAPSVPLSGEAGEGGYTNRLLDAKRRAQEKDE